MKKIIVFCGILLIAQLIALCGLIYVYTPRNVNNIYLDRNTFDLYSTVADEKVLYVVNNANEFQDQMQKTNPEDSLLNISQEDLHQITHVDYLLNIVENNTDRVVIRAFARTMTMQEGESQYLIYDMN